MLRITLLLFCLLLWIAPEFMSVYFIMPIGGSQEWDLFHLSYFIHNNIWIFRILFGIIFLYMGGRFWMTARNKYEKGLVVLGLLAYGVIVYMTNFVMKADKIFYQPSTKTFSNQTENTVSLDRLILGVEVEGQAKAFPVQYLAYHHQVVDTVGNNPVIVTYCSVCRTGRVFSSKVNGMNESFRLVGMSQWNAMFEDHTTGTWWQQATGEAIIGPLRGSKLEEVFVQTVTLGEWFGQYPNSLVMQADTLFSEAYDHYDDYEDGSVEGTLTRYDSTSWNDKSWVVGIEIGDKAIAYDWNDLKSKKLIQNTFEGTALMLLLGKGDKSFRVLNRSVGTDVFDFVRNDSTDVLMDTRTMSIWADHGECLEGELKGTQLEGVAASQEYWHSWKDFHPNTIRYSE